MIFLHADKYESFLQNYMNFDGVVKHSQSFQNSKCAMALRFLKKAARYEVDFLHTDKYQSFLPGHFNFFGMRFSYKVILSLLIDIVKHYSR